MTDVTAILPAAGAATRLDGVVKELLPVVFRRTEQGLIPVPALVHALEQVAAAGIPRAVVIVSPGKVDLVRTLADGGALGVELAWVVQPSPTGLTDAVMRGLSWCRGRAVLVLPDTVFEPASALREVALDDGEVTLAVFQTDRPEELGPVVMDGGRVTGVLDKPTGPCPSNSWGLVGMSAGFQAWLADRIARDAARAALPIGVHIDAALQAGMAVQARVYDGALRDLGTPHGLEDWVLG